MRFEGGLQRLYRFDRGSPRELCGGSKASGSQVPEEGVYFSLTFDEEMLKRESITMRSWEPKCYGKSTFRNKILKRHSCLEATLRRRGIWLWFTDSVLLWIKVEMMQCHYFLTPKTGLQTSTFSINNNCFSSPQVAVSWHLNINLYISQSSSLKPDTTITFLQKYQKYLDHQLCLLCLFRYMYQGRWMFDPSTSLRS